MHVLIELALSYIIFHLLLHFFSNLASYQVFNVHIYLRGLNIFGLVKIKVCSINRSVPSAELHLFSYFFGRSCSTNTGNVLGFLKQSLGICTENRGKSGSFKKQSMCGSVVMLNDSFSALWLMIIMTICGNPATTLASPFLSHSFPPPKWASR